MENSARRRYTSERSAASPVGCGSGEPPNPLTAWHGLAPALRVGVVAGGAEIDHILGYAGPPPAAPPVSPPPPRAAPGGPAGCLATGFTPRVA